MSSSLIFIELVIECSHLTNRNCLIINGDGTMIDIIDPDPIADDLNLTDEELLERVVIPALSSCLRLHKVKLKRIKRESNPDGYTIFDSAQNTQPKS